LLTTAIGRASDFTGHAEPAPRVHQAEPAPQGGVAELQRLEQQNKQREQSVDQLLKSN